MANSLYPKGAEKILSGAIDLTTDTIKAVLVKDSYTYSSAHEFLSDLSTHPVGTAMTLGSPTVTGGYFDASDLTFTAVPSATVESLVLYKDTGSGATSPLLAYFDSSPLPIASNGGDLGVTWNASGIFRIIL